MSENPLKGYFRKPSTYVKLPTLGLWYNDDTVHLTDDKEVAIYAMSALDDILLNTPDSMLNGQALEKVITSCVPDVKRVKSLKIPDLDAIFVGIKIASYNGEVDYTRKCPSCNTENTYGLNCQLLLDTATEIDVNDLIIRVDNDLLIHVMPYDFEMRQIFIKKEFESEKTLKLLDNSTKDISELEKANILANAVDEFSKITFELVSRSIEKIVIVKDDITITDRNSINEWLVNIDRNLATIVINSVDKLNKIGVSKEVTIQCPSCNHVWQDPISLDPSSFFVKRS